MLCGYGSALSSCPAEFPDGRRCNGFCPAEEHLTESVQSNVSIESALNTVKSQYGISIVTQIEGLDLSSKVSVDIKNASVTEALKEIFKPQQIDVKIDGNVAMISAAAAKNFTVKGIVTDSAGEPVPGAMILVMGTKDGVTTDIDGAYSLTLAKPATLKCTCLGFVDQETKVSKESNVNFTMTTWTRSLILPKHIFTVASLKTIQVLPTGRESVISMAVKIPSR